MNCTKTRQTPVQDDFTKIEAVWINRIRSDYIKVL